MVQNNQKWNGNEFWNVVQDAINSGNYQELNQQVKDSINKTVDGIRIEVDEGIRKGVHIYKNNFQAGDWKKASSVKKLNKKEIYAKQMPGKTSGVLCTSLGFTFAGFALLMTFTLGWLTPVLFKVFGGCFLGCMACGFVGVGLLQKFGRYKKYIRRLGEREYATIKDLSEYCGIPEKKVKKDLRRMIETKVFLQGHMDDQKTCVMVTDQMYQQYRDTQQRALELEEQKKLQEQARSTIPEECRAILEEGEDYIQFIHHCNDVIPGAVMSEKLDRLEAIITRIFAEVEKRPSLADELRRFMNYYLPTTKKLLDVYTEMDQEVIMSENVTKTKQEIENTIDTINQAFETMLDSFLKEKAMDVSADISVLHTMLSQEGLKKEPFQM